MPRKRASSSSTGIEPTPAKQAKVAPKARDRWSQVSGSRNAQASYHTIVAGDGDEAYKFTTLSRVPGCVDDDDDDDEDDEDANKENEEIRLGPDEVLEEVLNKEGEKEPPKDKPSKLEGNIVVTNAGFQKFAITCTHSSLRDPDNFDMYTFNDHAGYGQIEVVQNLFLDYTDARASADWGPQWAVIEATALFLNCGGAERMYMCDYPQLVSDTMTLAARMFLDGLARLEREKLLGPDSPVESLPLIIAVMLLLDQRSCLFQSIGERGAKEKSSVGAKLTGVKTVTFHIRDWANFVRHYALTYKITKLPKLPGYKKTKEDLPENAAEIERFALPEVTDAVTDPWNWAVRLAKYRRNYRKGNDIGGDEYDLTAWSSAQRKAKSFEGKDPLSKKDIDALKAGMVISFQ